jgi:hypothetical protein
LYQEKVFVEVYPILPVGKKVSMRKVLKKIN